MGYTKPTKETAKNALKDRFSSRLLSPRQLDYKSLAVGDYVDFRILRLDVVEQVPCRKITILTPKKRKLMKVTVNDPGSPHTDDLMDAEGTPFSECQRTTSYRLPVWVYRIRKGSPQNGEATIVEVNELQFLEFGPGIAKSIDELETHVQGMSEFNPDTHRPDYDIRLKIVAGTGSITKNYALEPIMFLPKKTAGQAATPHPHYGVEAEKVLKAYMADIERDWDAVVADCSILEPIDELKRMLTPYKEKADDGIEENIPQMTNPVDDEMVFELD